jgi:hypothetical protein
MLPPPPASSGGNPRSVRSDDGGGLALFPSWGHHPWSCALIGWTSDGSGGVCWVPRGGLRGNNDDDEWWFGCGMTLLVGILFRRVRLAYWTPCCEVGAAARVASGNDDLLGWSGWRPSSVQVLPISSSKLLFKIGAASLQREGPSVWHGSAWASRSHCSEVFLGGLFGEVGVASSGSSDDDDASEPPRRRVSSSSVCARLAFGSQGGLVCPRDVVFHDGRRGGVCTGFWPVSQ